MPCAACRAYLTAPATTSCRGWRRRNLPFEACLAEAQRLGYAEANPTFDIGGFDTAHKIAILASLAFGAKIDAAAVSVEGIEFDHPCRPRRRRRTRVPHQAAGRRRAHRRASSNVSTRRWSKVRAVRADHGCSQCGVDRWRRDRRTDAGRARGRGRRHGFGGRRRPVRHRAGPRRAGVRPARRSADRRRARADAAPRGRLLRAHVGCRPPRCGWR